MAVFTRSEDSLSNTDKNGDKRTLSPKAKANPLEDNQSEVITDFDIQKDR